jgi:hypothetical protein
MYGKSMGQPACILGALLLALDDAMAASRRIPVGLRGGPSVKFSEDVNRMVANDLWKCIRRLRGFLTTKGLRQVWSNRCRGRMRGYRPQLERLETRTALTGTWSTVTNLAPTQVPYANGGTTGIGTMELLSDGTVLAFSGWIRAASEGSSTGGNSATTLNDGTAAWTTNRWAGQTVYITGGTGVGETATVQSNSATKLILAMPGWSQAIPDASSTYSIGGPANDQQVYALRPDSSGSYVNGTWSAVAPAQGSIASLIDPRYVFPANMLNDGRLLVLGGEYSTHIASQDNLHEAEIYDPVTNLWTQTADPATGLHLGGAPTELLPDDRVLVSSIDNANTYTYRGRAATKIRMANGVDNADHRWLKKSSLSEVPTPWHLLHPLMRSFASTRTRFSGCCRVSIA